MIQSIHFFEKPDDILKYYDGEKISGHINTYDDWHIVANNRPIFSPPKVKTEYVDIPGGNGSLDLSESLTGYPVYENRTGTFDFRVLNDYGEWQERYSQIMEYLHGRQLYAVLDDDPNYFYQGRFTVDDWNSSDDTWSQITLGYTVNPFKWNYTLSTSPWVWDIFNFNTGIISDRLCDFSINSDEYISKKFPKDIFGKVPISPSIIVSNTSDAGIDIVMKNTYLNIELTQNFKNGSTFVPDFVFYGQSDDYELKFKGSGNIIISFRKGRL